MRKNFLLLLILIICTAAGAAVTVALTAPSDTEGAVEACFVTSAVLEKLKAGKEEIPFDASLLEFEGQPVPFDSRTDTIYIPQSVDSQKWEGKLYAAGEGRKIYILNEEDADKRQCLREGKLFKILIAGKEQYMEGTVVFTGLPVIVLEHAEEEIELNNEYAGMIRVLDPYRKEYTDSGCSFHIRGNTSVLFDKKSYRISLKDKSGEKTDLSFLGMRSDDDWILNSLSTDWSLSREKVCYELWERLNEMEQEPVASSQIEYAELVIGGVYKGIYGLMYPVDGKLMGMKPGDLLYKVKKWKEEMDVPGKLTDYNGREDLLNTNGYAYASIKYPNSPAGAFIWDPFEIYQDTVFESGDMDKMEKDGVRIRRSNFILHELFCEMTQAGDNTWKNLFLAAYKDEDGGYTLCETVWDLNYTFGDRFVWDPENGNTVFAADKVNDYKLRYDRDYGYTAFASADPGIRDETGEKWKKWREEGVSPEYISGLFKAQREFLECSGALRRNTKLWCGAQDNTDPGSIEEWIGRRFEFLDDMYGVLP